MWIKPRMANKISMNTFAAIKDTKQSIRHETSAVASKLHVIFSPNKIQPMETPFVWLIKSFPRERILMGLMINYFAQKVHRAAT